MADTKYTNDIASLFKKGKEAAEKRPNALISDGAPNFHQSLQQGVLHKQVAKNKAYQPHQATGRPQQQQDGEVKRND